MTPAVAYANRANIDTLVAQDIAFDADVLVEIRRLNERLATAGEDIEGNVCYADGTKIDQLMTLPSKDIDLVIKRLNLVTLARRRSSMLEIGVNGGHSALLCMISNPRLHFYGVDICFHKYTAEAVTHFKQRFGRRFHFWSGDSREVMPRLFLDRPNLKFDLLHIDGGHTPDLAIADMSNAIRMAEKGADLILDDVNYPPLGAALEHLTSHGWLGPLEDHSGLRETVLHQILRVC